MTWTAPDLTRSHPWADHLTGDERSLADAWLDHHRETLLWKCAGPTAAYWSMVEEYARHNGHADLLRERIDGSTGH
ncbi:hypothetical protein H4W34_007584 [Actinomadura algeriensis]|uniref:DUF664 domain-containing protein n=1 Tax=Actinomadura algeriensis TaxID=1679523 RepID=A0ABR9K589_9ACTN|nr:DUF664 domain-containing protein [Actinomadura algeriensis]MBE1537751.1 hypothetical protein [Actinomadura algeriensis]